MGMCSQFYDPSDRIILDISDVQDGTRWTQPGGWGRLGAQLPVASMLMLLPLPSLCVLFYHAHTHAHTFTSPAIKHTGYQQRNRLSGPTTQCTDSSPRPLRQWQQPERIDFMTYMSWPCNKAQRTSARAGGALLSACLSPVSARWVCAKRLNVFAKTRKVFLSPQNVSIAVSITGPVFRCLSRTSSIRGLLLGVEKPWRNPNKALFYFLKLAEDICAQVKKKTFGFEISHISKGMKRRWIG